MTDFISEFLEHLRDNNYIPKDGKVVADDKWHPAYYGEERGAKCTGAYTMKIVDGNFAIGCFFTRKDPDKKNKWHSRFSSDLRMTATDRAERNRRMKEYEEEKRKREEKADKRFVLRITAAYKKLPKYADLKLSHRYLERKGITDHGIRYRKKGHELIVPFYAPDGRVQTVQRITSDGGKFLFKGGKKKRAYFPFVKRGENLSTILLCEGFATGATIRQATKLPVAACIDSGNIIWALDTLKKKYPQSKIIICADSDAWTFDESKRPKHIKTKEVPADSPLWNEWREAGLLNNVGLMKARAAAAKCGGTSIVTPDFTGYDITDRPTDFNDLAALAGEQVVAEQIMAVVNSIPEKGEAAEGLELSVSDQQPLGGEHYGENPAYLTPDHPPEKEPQTLEPIKIQEKGDFDLNFRCLGHDGGVYYYFSFKERRIVSMSPSAHTINNLLQLDVLDNWYNSMFGQKGTVPDKKLALYAQNAMIELCQKRGVFREENSVRGAGAWIDDGRVVVNCGDQLYVDGKIIPMDAIESEFTYVETPKYLRPDRTVPLTNTEAVVLKTICEGVTWENPLSGSLLAGWLVIAPVCGALEYSTGMEYRPHIWITGEAESGKSTVIRRIVRVVLGRIALNFEGGTTEASIREIAGHDARPLVYDEAEPSQTMQNVIELARKATTGGVVGKYGQGQMRIRFAACFSSINPPISKAADETRISLLTIKKNRKVSAMDDFERLTRLMDAHLNDDFSRRLIARTIDNMHTLLANIKTFQRAARTVIGSARASEQIGTMLAGLHLLHSTKTISEELATEWVKKYKWNDHTAVDQKSEPEKLLQFISGYHVRFTTSAGVTRDTTLGELILDASSKGEDQDKFLRRHGIARVHNDVYFAVKHDQLQKTLRGTEWPDSYAARLSELDGAERHQQSFYFSSGIRTSAVKIPISYFEGERQMPARPVKPQEEYYPEEEIPFDE